MQPGTIEHKGTLVMRIKNVIGNTKVRLGRLIPAKGPGIIFIIPLVDKLKRVSLRLITMDVPPQDVIPYQLTFLKSSKKFAFSHNV